MRNKAAEKQNSPALNETQDSHGATKPTRRKKYVRIVLIGLGVLVVLGTIGALAAYLLLWQNSPAKVLVESIRNTAGQKMLKFEVAVNTSKPNDTGTVLTGSAKYKDKSGLTADIDSKISSEYGRLAARSSWVITADGSTYVNRVSLNIEQSEAGKKKAAATYSTSIDKINIMLNLDDGKWRKQEGSSNPDSSIHGLSPCLLSAIYTTLSHPADLTELLQDIDHTKGLSVKRDGTNYTVEMQSESRSNINTTYKDSTLYKHLQKCDQASTNTSQNSSLGDILADTRLQFEVDDNGLIKKIAATAKTGLTLTVTISVANDVKIIIPQVTPPEVLKLGETLDQYLQRVNPQAYSRLKSLNEAAD